MKTKHNGSTTPQPEHLRPPTRSWFLSVLDRYELEEHHVRLLIKACECWDRSEEAREALATGGLTYLDRYGCPHPRPEVAISRECIVTFARVVRELDLDVEPPVGESRPPALRSNRRLPCAG